MHQKHFRLAVFVIALLIAGVFVAAGASGALTGTLTNIISTSQLSIKLHDEVADGSPFPTAGLSDVMPSQKYSKVVYVENTCSESEWIRVHLTDTVTSGGVDVTTIATKYIELDLNPKWVQSGEWFYYSEELAPGKKTEPLFTEVSFSPEMDNVFAGAQIEIIVDAQAVQSINNGDSISTIVGWPGDKVDHSTIVSASTIKPAKDKDLRISQASFADDGAFICDPESTDMFTNFKDVMPGDTLTQTINVSNELKGDAVRVYLYADVPAEEDRALLDMMSLAVYNGNKLISEDTASSQGELKERVLLGTIAPGANVQLTVNLAVSPAMGNEFAKKAGTIVWHLDAEKSTPSSTDISQTSDFNRDTFIKYSVIAGALVLAFGSPAVLRRKKEENING